MNTEIVSEDMYLPIFFILIFWLQKVLFIFLESYSLMILIFCEQSFKSDILSSKLKSEIVMKSKFASHEN